MAGTFGTAKMLTADDDDDDDDDDNVESVVTLDRLEGGTGDHQEKLDLKNNQSIV